MNFSKVAGLFTILCLTPGILFAASTSYSSAYCRHPHRLYFDLGVGKAYDYGSSHSFLIGSNGNVLGNLQTGNSYSTPFFFVGIGYRWAQDNSPWFPSVNLGLQHRYTSPVNVFGVSQTSLVDPIPTSYNYRLQQESWLLMSKADIYKWKKFMPYLALGLGASFNRITQLFINSATFANQLGGSTSLTSDFSYNVGAGIDYQVKDDFWLTLGYFYDNFGKNKVGTVYTNNAFTPVGRLENANLHSNSVFLSARYLFW